MNTKEFIESGILESYVLGFTSDEETAQVETALKQHPELTVEVESLRGTLEEFAINNAITPPPALRDRVLEAIEKLREEEREAQVVAFEPESTETKTRSLWSTPWLAAASVVLLLASALSNYVLYNRWQNSETRLATLESQNQIIAQELQVTKSNYVAMNDELGVLRQFTTQKIKLAGTPDSPESSATVYWNKEKKEVYLTALNLPDVPTNKQYQLWAIVNGKPVDIGVFDMGKNLLRLKDVSDAQAFAISLEARGGSTTEAGPKGQVYLMGKV